MATQLLRSWQRSPFDMPAARARGFSAQHDRWVYVVGGTNAGGTVIADTFVGRIDDDGNLKDWRLDRALPITMQVIGPGAFCANGYLYCMGGLSGTAQASIYTAKVLSDGGLGPWTVQALPMALQQFNFQVVNDRWVYVFGGIDTSAARRAECYVAQLFADGSIGQWRRIQDYPEGISSQTRSVYFAGHIFTSLGFDGGSPGTNYTDIWSAKVDNATGDLMPWRKVGAFNAARGRTASFLVDDLWVVAAGVLSPLNPGTVASATAAAVRLYPDGTCGVASDPGMPLPIATYTPFKAQWKRRIFVIGGNDSSTTRTPAVQTLDFDT